MRIKDLFTVPTNQKVTEKYLYRVLISSVCSILLCMASLAGTTWAWYTVSIENEGNVIQIAQEAEVNVYVNESTEPFSPGTSLPQDVATIKITHKSEPDAFNQKSTLYVTIMLGEHPAGYVILDSRNGYEVKLEYNGDAITLSWAASWFEPDIQALEGNTINAVADDEESSGGTKETTTVVEQESEETDETTKSTEITTEDQEDSETEVPSESDSNSSEENTDLADTETESTEATTETQTNPVTEEPGADTTTTQTEGSSETGEAVIDPGENETDTANEEVPIDGAEETSSVEVIDEDQEM